MSALETYAKQAQIVKGTYHLAAIQSLRSYIKLTPEEELIKYINMITDLDLLRILQEAGIRGDANRALISRMNLLAKQQEEAKK